MIEPVGQPYKPPDPIKWLERLLDVNAGSDFSAGEKEIIDMALRGALWALTAAKR